MPSPSASSSSSGSAAPAPPAPPDGKPGPLGAQDLSQRVRALAGSATLAIAGKARDLKAQGADVISFSLGEPDFDTPKPIRDAAIEALQRGETHYLPTLGDHATRASIAEKLWRENSIAGLTPNHVAISVGVKHAIYNVCQSLFDIPSPGEAAWEAILPVPAWVSYAPIVRLSGGRVVEAKLSAASGFRLTPAILRPLITPRTRVLFLTSPSNPTGVVHSRSELEALARVVSEAAATIAPKITIVTDEIYEKIIYDGHEHFSIGSLASVADRTITLNGMSKAFAMTGWRIGYCACPGEFGKALIQAIDRFQGQVTNNITSFTYAAVRAAMEGKADADVAWMRESFERRARLIFDLASRVDGLRAHKPEGAFYLFPNVSAWLGRKTAKGKLLVNTTHIAEALMDEHLLAIIPGSEFGGEGDQHIRLSYSCDERSIERGMDRLRQFAAGLQ